MMVDVIRAVTAVARAFRPEGSTVKGGLTSAIIYDAPYKPTPPSTSLTLSTVASCERGRLWHSQDAKQIRKQFVVIVINNFYGFPWSGQRRSASVTLRISILTGKRGGFIAACNQWIGEFGTQNAPSLCGLLPTYSSSSSINIPVTKNLPFQLLRYGEMEFLYDFS
jgi:hypothetical protein